MRTSGATASIFFLFIFCSVSFAQPVVPSLNDDFYVIDIFQPINTYENDLNFAGTDWVLVTPPAHGGVGPGCSLGLGCCRYCVYFGPSDNYTGFDTYQYRHEVCCGNPPGPPSNTATVNLLLIGNDDAQNAGACRFPVPSPNVGKPVNVTNGNMWLEQTDYSLPGIGEPIELNRFYNSIIQTSGLFGFGWSTKYDEPLQIYPTTR